MSQIHAFWPRASVLAGAGGGGEGHGSASLRRDVRVGRPAEGRERGAERGAGWQAAAGAGRGVHRGEPRGAPLPSWRPGWGAAAAGEKRWGPRRGLNLELGQRGLCRDAGSGGTSGISPGAREAPARASPWLGWFSCRGDVHVPCSRPLSVRRLATRARRGCGELPVSPRGALGTRSPPSPPPPLCFVSCTDCRLTWVQSGCTTYLARHRARTSSPPPCPQRHAGPLHLGDVPAKEETKGPSQATPHRPPPHRLCFWRSRVGLGPLAPGWVPSGVVTKDSNAMAAAWWGTGLHLCTCWG